MQYVVVQRDNDDLIVHGPFHTEQTAQWYTRRLEYSYPDSRYEIHHITPERNLPKTP